MAPIAEIITGSILPLLEGIKQWRDRKDKSSEEQKEKIEAISKVMEAAVATKAYIYDSRKLGNASREQESELSRKWQEAAPAVWRYDENLFNSANVKALGWADPSEWKKRANEAVTVDLDEIIEQCRWHMSNTSRNKT